VSHARIALHLILKSLNLPVDSKIILTGINISDMLNVIKLNNLPFEFCDYKKESFEIDTKSLLKLICPQTRVVFITYLAGAMVNVEEVYNLCKEKNVILILDITQSVFLKINNMYLNKYADFVFFSLCDLKDIHTHRGAIILGGHGKLDLIRAGYVHSSTRPSIKYFLYFVLEDFLGCVLLNRYLFTIFFYPFLRVLYYFNKMEKVIQFTKGKGITLGPIIFAKGLWGGGGSSIGDIIPSEMLYRYTNLQADLGIRALQIVDKVIDTRVKNARLMNSLINKDLPVLSDSAGHIYWKYPIRVKNIFWWQKRLFSYGIDAAPTNLPSLSKLAFDNEVVAGEQRLLGVNYILNHILYVPIHYYLEEDDIHKIAFYINSIFEEEKAIFHCALAE
jgi:dTDP-4-amino-4,6-dideoxygalactose transaminase